MLDNGIVVYSALFGLAEPPNLEIFGGFGGCRKILITDNPNLAMDDVEVIVSKGIPNDPVRSARQPKHCPHRFFGNFDWSIWIDNKSSLLMQPSNIVDELSRQDPDGVFFAFPHFRRNCLYDEAKTVIQNGLDDRKIVRKQIKMYRNEGMPKSFGLIESHFLVRKNVRDVRDFGDAWYEEIKKFSRRDQISFPYLARKMGLHYTEICNLSWEDTVKFSVFDRAARVPDFKAASPMYLAARRTYHRIRRIVFPSA